MAIPGVIAPVDINASLIQIRMGSAHQQQMLINRDRVPIGVIGLGIWRIKYLGLLTVFRVCTLVNIDLARIRVATWSPYGHKGVISRDKVTKEITSFCI
jgi:hypothetical protein